MADISEQGQQGEKRAQNIFAFRYPGHGFNMQGVPAEQCCNQRTGPEGVGQTQPQRKQQPDVRHVEQDTGQMMAGGIQAKDFAIHHVRKPRQRMPVAGVPGGERPFDARAGEPLLDHRIPGHVVRIVQVHETIPQRRQIGHQGDQQQQQAHGART